MHSEHGDRALRPQTVLELVGGAKLLFQHRVVGVRCRVDTYNVATMQGVALPDQLSVRLLHPAARVPQRRRSGDAGFDLHVIESVCLKPGERAVAGTGLALALPEGVAGLVLPRSGLAAEYGLSLVNSPGLVDPNYRGEVLLILANLGSQLFNAVAGDRLAQLLLVTYWAPTAEVVRDLPEASDDRGSTGLGSSGR